MMCLLMIWECGSILGPPSHYFQVRKNEFGGLKEIISLGKKRPKKMSNDVYRIKKNYSAHHAASDLTRTVIFLEGTYFLASVGILWNAITNYLFLDWEVYPAAAPGTWGRFFHSSFVRACELCGELYCSLPRQWPLKVFLPGVLLAGFPEVLIRPWEF